MEINVYFDRDGQFLAHLVQGSQIGYNIEEWMELLYQSQDDKYKPIQKKVYKPYFPCIIVVHKSLFLRLMQYLDEHKKTLEKTLKIYYKLPYKEQTAGLWPTYKKYLNGEIVRVRGLRKVVDNYQKNLERHLQQQCSFVNNSSIWIRLVDWKQSEIIEAVNEMEYFNRIGLYDYGSAKENLKYNILIQSQNYLVSTSGGHSNYVTPELYGDEVKAMKILLGNNAPKTT